MNRLVQSFDWNFIKNLWQIIEIRVSAQQHRIYCLEEMEKVIKKKWNKLTEEDFGKCIGSKNCCWKLFILARDSFIKYYYTHFVEC